MRGRHGTKGRHGTRVRRRRAVVGASAVTVVGASVLGFVLLRDGVERVCTRPTDLRTSGNVTLVAGAMDAFAEAEAAVGHDIDVVESYRSCRDQRQACRQICGSGRGCPGTCAPPGLSWHQRGAAVDVTQEMLDTPGVIGALEEAGWCQALPDSDPGHFSFDGCH